MRRLSFNNNFVLSWTFVCNRNQCNLRFCFWANGKYSFKSKLTTDRAAFIFRVFQFLILITRDVALLPCVVARHACGGVDTRARHTCVNHPWVPEILVTSFVLAHCTEIDSPGEHHIRIVFFSGRDIFHTLRYRTNMNWRRQFSREMGGGREIAIRWSSFKLFLGLQCKKVVVVWQKRYRSALGTCRHLDFEANHLTCSIFHLNFFTAMFTHRRVSPNRSASGWILCLANKR